MYLEYLARVLRAMPTQSQPVLATYMVAGQRFAVEVASTGDAAQIEQLLKAVVAATRADQRWDEAASGGRVDTTRPAHTPKAKPEGGAS